MPKKNSTKIALNFLRITSTINKIIDTISTLPNRLKNENGVINISGILFCSLTVVSKSKAVKIFLWTKYEKTTKIIKVITPKKSRGRRWCFITLDLIPLKIVLIHHQFQDVLIHAQ